MMKRETQAVTVERIEAEIKNDEMVAAICFCKKTMKGLIDRVDHYVHLIEESKEELAKFREEINQHGVVGVYKESLIR